METIIKSVEIGSLIEIVLEWNPIKFWIFQKRVIFSLFQLSLQTEILPRAIARFLAEKDRDGEHGKIFRLNNAVFPFIAVGVFINFYRWQSK